MTAGRTLAWRMRAGVVVLAVAAMFGGAFPAAAAIDLKHGLQSYRRCIEIRSIVSPRILASQDERTIGAALDCARHHGRTVETITSPATPVPRVLRSKVAKAAVARLLHRHH